MKLAGTLWRWRGRRRPRSWRGGTGQSGPSSGASGWGRCYDAVAAKQARADAYLAALAADPDAVRRLCGLDWLTAALDALPAA